jgi:hypothetical protein
MNPFRPAQRGWRRFHDAWTKNDGKPKERWASGRDLKESVMAGALIVVTAITIGILAYSLFA